MAVKIFGAERSLFEFWYASSTSIFTRKDPIPTRADMPHYLIHSDVRQGARGGIDTVVYSHVWGNNKFVIIMNFSGIVVFL